jgi:hypothetical protein
MTNNIIRFKYYDGKTSSYHIIDEVYHLNDRGFEYNVGKNSVAGTMIDYLDPYNKLKRGVTYFRSNGENSIVTRVSKINLCVVIPVLRWKLEQLYIKADVTYQPEEALVINFPNKAEYSLFMFRFDDIFGKKE